MTDVEHAIAESDVIALLVDHSCFRAIKKTQLAGKVVYDTRGDGGNSAMGEPGLLPTAVGGGATLDVLNNDRAL